MATPKIQGEKQKKTMASASLAVMNARQIIQQADIATIKEIPNLPSHQRAAKKQSNKLEHEIWPLIINVTSDVIDYANTFEAAYAEMCALVPQLKLGRKEAKNDFVQVLEKVLIPTLQTKSTTAKNIASQLNDFHTSFQPLYSGFQADFQEANEVMTKDKEEIRQKQKELRDWKNKAADYQVGYTVAAVSMPITAAATLKFSETGVAVIIGGILFGVEVATFIALLSEYADAMHHVNDLTYEISDLQEEVAQLTVVEHQITGLQKHTVDSVSHCFSVADGWESLQASLQDILRKVKTTAPADIVPVIEKQLLEASKEWDVALKQAKALLPNGGRLEQKTFKNSAEMLTAIDEQAKQGA